MRKITFIGALSLVTAMPAAAGFGDIVSSFPIPAQVPASDALTWDGTYLWVCHRMGTYFFRLTTTGSLLSSFRIYPGGGMYNFEGAAFDGQYLWCSDHYYQPWPGFVIYRCLTTSGSLVRTFGHPPYPLYYAGMTYQPGYLWGERFKYNMAGSLVSSFVMPFPLGDLAWDGHYLWAGNKQLTTDGSFVASFALPPSALTDQTSGGTTFDGNYLWITLGSWAYQFDINVTGVDSGSFGKIKALYR
jgi:hypothetical protein